MRRWAIAITMLSMFIAALPLRAEDAPAVSVSVDPRVELTSIIFRLAGNPEYSRCRLTGYAADIDKHFADQREHAVVKLAKQLRAKHGVPYDAVANMAVHLDMSDGVKPALPLDPRPASLEGRWQVDDAKRFIELADDFARQSKFDQFIKGHKPLYDDLARQMQQLLDDHAKLDWFGTFFGKGSGTAFHVIIAPVNGPSNYGARVDRDGRVDMYAIMGVWKQSTWTGKPIIDTDMLPTIIHEFAHSYCNRLIDANAEALAASGELLFASRRKQMKKQAYSNWRTMMYESLVRACEVRYAWDTAGTKAAGDLIRRHQRRGFEWTGDLANLLGEYEQNREKYKTMHHFMPRVIELFNDAAAQEAGE